MQRPLTIVSSDISFKRHLGLRERKCIIAGDSSVNLLNLIFTRLVTIVLLTENCNCKRLLHSDWGSFLFKEIWLLKRNRFISILKCLPLSKEEDWFLRVKCVKTAGLWRKKKSFSSFWLCSAGRNWAVWWQQMSFALRSQEIILLFGCYSEAIGDGIFFPCGVIGLDGFSTMLYWW